VHPAHTKVNIAFFRMREKKGDIDMSDHDDNIPETAGDEFLEGLGHFGNTVSYEAGNEFNDTLQRYADSVAFVNALYPDLMDVNEAREAYIKSVPQEAEAERGACDYMPDDV
jgi:hypothetical protein